MAEEEKKLVSLLMLSGGLDSTWALWKLLTQTDDEVLVHHIHLITDLRREEPEKISCRDIVKYCREHARPFTYSETAIDHRGMASHGFDLIACGLAAGVVSSSYQLQTGRMVDRWIVGLSTEDRVPEHRLIRADRVCRYNSQVRDSPFFYRFPPVSQQDVINEIPFDLYKMTWSCRQPVVKASGGFRACGTCGTCMRLEPYAHQDLVKSESELVE